MKSKGAIAVITIIIVIVAISASTITWIVASKIQAPSIQQSVLKSVAPKETSTNSRTEIVRKYTNEKNGYEIQYPDYFQVDESNLDNVIFSKPTSKPTCYTENENIFCSGIDFIRISVQDNPEEKDLDQTYNYLKKIDSFSKCKKIKVESLPVNFNKDELLNAIRCEEKELPKFDSGRYTYTILKENKLFVVNVEQLNSYILTHMDGTSQRDTYDSMGDMMMRTFKFTK